jgi:hypothetical protein
MRFLHAIAVSVPMSLAFGGATYGIARIAERLGWGVTRPSLQCELAGLWGMVTSDGRAALRIDENGRYSLQEFEHEDEWRWSPRSGRLAEAGQWNVDGDSILLRPDKGMVRRAILRFSSSDGWRIELDGQRYGVWNPTFELGY